MYSFTRETLIRDILTADPASATVFERYGLGCPACLGADMESISSVATMHEISVDDLLADLNALSNVNDGVGA